MSRPRESQPLAAPWVIRPKAIIQERAVRNPSSSARERASNEAATVETTALSRLTSASSVGSPSRTCASDHELTSCADKACAADASPSHGLPPTPPSVEHMCPVYATAVTDLQASVWRVAQTTMDSPEHVDRRRAVCATADSRRTRRTLSRMNLSAVDPLYAVGGVACAGLGCLFLVSAVVLVVVLVRRHRRGGSDQDSAGVA